MGFMMAKNNAAITVSMKVQFGWMPVEISVCGDIEDIGKALWTAEEEAKNSAFRLYSKVIPDYESLTDAYNKAVR